MYIDEYFISGRKFEKIFNVRSIKDEVVLPVMYVGLLFIDFQ